MSKSTNRKCSPACACADALRWLDATGHNLTLLTGTSSKALCAVAHLWQLYAYTRSESVLRAIAELVPSLGNSAGLARELAAWAMNWDNRAVLWDVVERFAQATQVRVSDAEASVSFADAAARSRFRGGGR